MKLLLLAVLIFLTSLAGSIVLYFFSSYNARRINKNYAYLYVIGYKNGVVFLGTKSDGWVDSVGLIPLAKAKLRNGEIKSAGAVDFVLRPRFCLNDSIPYNVDIIQRY